MGNNGDPLGVNIEIERLRARVTEAQIAAVPRVPCKPDAPIAGDASHRIKRLCVVRQLVHDECRALATRGAQVDLQRQAFLNIIERHLELEIWRHFPELTGQAYIIYENWHIGPEESRTGDLFRSAGPKELATSRSTRSSDVNIGAVLHAPA